MCVCVGVVMYECVYMWVCDVRVCVCMYRFCNVCMCVGFVRLVGFVMCVCVCVCVCVVCGVWVCVCGVCVCVCVWGGDL